MKRRDFVPGVQFQIADPRDGRLWKAVYTYDHVDPESKYPTEILRLANGELKGDVINAKLSDEGLQIFRPFGGLWLESKVVPLKRLIPFEPEQTTPQSNPTSI